MSIALTGECPLCGRVLRTRYRRSDRQPFVGCTGYPDCTYTCDYDDVIERLHDEMEELRQQKPSDDHRELKAKLRSVIFDFHPDRAGNSVETHVVTTRLNELLRLLR